MNAKNFPKRLDSKTSYLRITVPENLDLALEGLIRKVLKEQPKIDDIYSFAANYFETLLKIRDKAGAKFTADQLCPFHSDEDAHEMIKLAATFSKPDSKEIRKKDEESLLLPKTENIAKNNDLDNKAQDKKSVGKPKSKELSTVEQNKQAVPELTKQLPTAVKNITNEEKKQTKVAHKRLGDVNIEKNEKNEESNDEFLASDPIKELVEKELMETKSSGKRKEIKETAATNLNVLMTSDELIENTNIQEERKAVGKIIVQPELNDANEPFKEEYMTIEENLVEKDEENKSRSEEIEETKTVKVNEIKFENNQAREQTSEKNTSDVKEEKKIKTADAKEMSNKQLEVAEGGNKESIKSTTEIDPKNETDLKIVTKEETKSVEKTNESTENTEEKKITADRNNITVTKNNNDKASDLETTKLEEQTLTEKMQSEDKIDEQSIVMMEEITERSSETLNDVTEKDANKAICSEIFETNNVKEQNEKNVKTSQEIPPNQIQPEEKEPKEPLNDQQTPRINNQTGRETAAKDENSESTAENKTEETSVINLEPPVTDSETEGNNDQELKEQEKGMTGDEAEPAIMIKAKDLSPKKDEPTNEVLKKTELNIEDDANQTEQTSKATVQVRDTQMDKPENKQYVLKSDEKPSKTGNITEDNKDENTVQNAEALQSKANGTKLVAEQVISTNENTVDKKLESESTMSQIDSKSNFLKGKLNELSSADKKSSQRQDNNAETSSPKPLSANPNEVIKSEKNEKPLNETTEDTLFGEKTHDFEQDNEDPQTPEGFAITSQKQKKEISETQKELGVNRIVAESQLTIEGSITQEEENVRKLEDEAFSSLALNPNKPSTEKMNEALTSAIPDTEETQSKDDTIESKKELRVGDSDNRNQNFKAEDGSVKTEEDLSPEVVTHQIPKDDETCSDKLKFKTSTEREEVKSNPEDELCTVVDVHQISKEDEIDRNKPEEKYKLEAENTENKEDKTKVEERTIKEEKLHIITVEEADKTEKNQEMSQPSGEVQIKTIQSHYYNTLQVPETVTKEYRVHNISSPTVSTLLNVANSLQQSYEHKHELLNKEEPSEKVVDVNMNTTVEKANNLSSFTELAKTAIPTEDEKFDNLQSGDHSIKSGDHELEFNAQKSDSDDLLDLMTPISGFSLSLSELSWQTINELFLDSEKRHSSLEKEENRYAAPKTNKITGESGEQKTTEVRQEIEEVIHKSVVSSNTEAVPVPPRDLETNKQTPESIEEKKKEKPEGESAESSSDSSNEQISVNDTPFISVEVKTVIETQILDDDDADDDGDDHIRNKELNSEEKTPPDMKIKVETTIDFINEVEMSQSESEHREDKTETTVGTRRNGLKSSLEVQDKNWREKPMESSSAEQTAGGEGSSGESDSTISSAATEIKRGDFAKRNFSSTRSLLSTQSLDLEKKNQLVKTMSLSTFRHGVTDFEVWNTIEKELEEAATKIQSKFRGYKTRKKLQRENAVQITTEESSGTEEIKNECQQSTGEFHDSIILSEHPC